MKKIARRGGFTLPEVLVTVTVVAVLAAVVVPAVTQYVSRGNGPASQSDIEQIRNAVTAYVADTRQYPGHLSDLTSTSGPSGFHGPYLSADVVGATGALATTQTAFTSNGSGIAFADSIFNTGHFLWLSVTAPTTCAQVFRLDTILDNADGNVTGNLRFAPAATSNSCTTPTTAVTADSLV
ncbi:MAG TPA: prepilin-type N-terminal cleavage/methylation domain-containing protein, partial [Gemmatimonadaceae bacterium]|nr:prepilin-type N-terminal cleavage/methylation domain-containing protein [Gemmatimonadaceae bacterium]